MTSVLGVDVGTVRLGLAVSDPTGVIASPAGVLKRSDPGMWTVIGNLISERAVDRAVVGLPRKLDGSEGDSAALARAFADELQTRTGLTVEWWDERFTTAQAERSLIEAGMRRHKRRQTIDSVAATLILQSWLDSRPRDSQ